MARIVSLAGRGAVVCALVVSVGAGALGGVAAGAPRPATTAHSSGSGPATTRGTLAVGGISGSVTGFSAGVCASASMVRATTASTSGATFGFGASSRSARYAIFGLRAGIYEITVAACGSNAGRMAPVLFRQRVIGGIQATAHTVALTGATGGAGASSPSGKPSGSTISGTVVDRGGTGVPGVCVSATRGGERREAVSGKGGRYAIDGLAAGSYALAADPCETSANLAPEVMAHNVTVGTGTVVGPVVVTLRDGATIAGTVRRRSGQPLGGICVVLSPQVGATAHERAIALISEFDPAWLEPTPTSSGGAYSIGQLPPWAFHVTYAARCGDTGNFVTQYFPGVAYSWLASPAQAHGGQTLTENVVLAPGGTIAGDVATSSNEPAHLCLTAGPPTEIGTPSLHLDGRRALVGDYFSALVGPSGSFHLRGLPAGAYSVLVAPSCYISRSSYAGEYGGTTPVAPGQLVSVGTGQDVKHLRFSAPAGSTVSGVLREGGALAANVPVCLTLEQPHTGLPVLSAIVEATSRGRYRLGELPIGSYIVEAQTCAPRSFAPEWSGEADRLRNATSVRLLPGSPVHGVNFDLPPAGRIRGLVTIPNGRPIRHACVSAVGGGDSGFAATRKNGTFSIAGLASARYLVSVSRCDNVVTEYSGVTVPSVKVRDGAVSSGLHATLQKGGYIAGVIRDANGDPVNGACLVTKVPHGTVGPTQLTQPNGAFELFGVPPGRVRVRVEPWCSLAVGLGPATDASVTMHAGLHYKAPLLVMKADGAIAGLVRAGGDGPVAGVCVLAVPTGSAARGVPTEVAETTGSGSYVLEQLLPIRYDVEFSSGCGSGRFVAQWWKKAATKAAATAVKVSNGRTVSGIGATLTSS